VSKPIFVIRFPLDVPAPVVQSNCKQIQTKFTDYHVLTLRDNRADRVEFECYSLQDVNTQDFENLKKDVLNLLDFSKQA
jgi:hypothetical protein